MGLPSTAEGCVRAEAMRFLSAKTWSTMRSASAILLCIFKGVPPA